MASDHELLKVPEKEYGDRYRDHCLEMYHAFIESAERISDRRHSANTFFLTVNTALLGISGYLQTGFIAIGGVVLSYTWFRLIKSYRSMNTAKFKVIHDMEQQLPFAPYDAEWGKLERGKNPKIHTPFSKVEKTVPVVFMILHGLAFLSIVIGFFYD